jgi:L-iditol 2-dehydrogenase
MTNKNAKDNMLAVRGYGPYDYRLEEVPIPRAGPEEVVIKVGKAGICASDVHRYAGTHLYWEGMLASQLAVPYIPGHEFVGEVVELGPGAFEKYEVELGDKAICEQSIPCWNCRFCISGKYWMCSHKKKRDGAMAEYMRFPQGAVVHKVPDSLTDDLAVMIEPLSCAIHAVRRGTIDLGDVVVIAGSGAIGLCMLQVAKLKTPDMAIVLDVREDRLEIAREVGADLTINVAKEDPVAKVKELTDNDGCDVFIDSSGSPKAVVDGLNMIRRLGTFVEFAVFEEDVKVDWSIIGDVKEIDIRGAHLSPFCYPLAIKYLQKGLVRVDRILTHDFPLSRFEEAFELALSRDPGVLKVTLTPGA